MADDLDALLARDRRDAILLHRPYPPHTAKCTNSHLGGLPRLPAHHEWPRTSAGTPLHFLAQIDCAELPIPTPLPDRGVLFFFGRDDAEQVWNYDGKPADDCRVLHILDAFAATQPRPVPDDLPPIGDEYGSHGARDFLRDGEAGPNVHTRWPVELTRVDSWPDAIPEERPTTETWGARLLNLLRSPPPEITWQETDERQQRYLDELEHRRATAFAAAPGGPAFREREHDQDGKAASAVFFHAGEGPEAYPQYWAMIHYAARALLRRPQSAVPFRHPRSIAPASESAASWLARADAAGLDQPVPPAMQAEFRACLAALTRPKWKPPLPYDAQWLVFASLLATIRAWAGDPAHAALIPPHVYEAMRFAFTGGSVWGLQYSQMLGHAPSAQEPLALDDPTVCLLNLASDNAMGWMFGDVGNCTFWIKPEDLARRDFSQAWATIEGH